MSLPAPCRGHDHSSEALRLPPDHARRALRALGCTLRRDGAVLEITGLGGRLAVKKARLFLGNAGTAMRPLAAALALLSAAQGGRFELSGIPRMHERPIGDLVDALRPLGCAITCLAPRARQSIQPYR